MFYSLQNQNTGILPPKGEQADKSPEKSLLDWPASYLDGFQPIDPEHWALEIGGLVEKPQAFTLKDFAQFTRIQQNRRLVFADGFTYRAMWEGFVVQELLHRVSPRSEAKYLLQTNLSGQTECVSLRDLYTQRALFCLKANGKNLPAIYGGPLRLMVFDRYAHKGLGQLARLDLVEEEVPGYFATKGYNPTGAILPGDYYASDLQSMQAIKNPGEITQW